MAIHAIQVAIDEADGRQHYLLVEAEVERFYGSEEYDRGGGSCETRSFAITEIQAKRALAALWDEGPDGGWREGTTEEMKGLAARVGSLSLNESYHTQLQSGYEPLRDEVWLTCLHLKGAA